MSYISRHPPFNEAGLNDLIKLVYNYMQSNDRLASWIIQFRAYTNRPGSLWIVHDTMIIHHLPDAFY